MTSDKTTTDKSSKVSTILLPVFVPSVLVIALMVIGTMSNPERAGALFADVLAYITTTFGWFYMLAVAIFLLFIVSVACSSWGNIKLGPDHAEPEYSFFAWFAMLFSAGYGIALLFFAINNKPLVFLSILCTSPYRGNVESVIDGSFCCRYHAIPFNKVPV